MSPQQMEDLGLNPAAYENGPVSFLVAVVIVAAMAFVLLRLWRRRVAYMQAVRDFHWDPGMSPTDFERHCADYLGARGWKARTTKGSGDQGIDVVAEKRGVRVVLQCKKYSRPVGNKAVQEAHAGMAFARAHRAAVVTNQTYTPGARQLAGSTGVLLLHFTDLSRADSLFGIQNNTDAPDVVGSVPFVEERTDRAMIRCPKCRLTLRLPAGRVGVVRCPGCSHRFETRT